MALTIEDGTGVVGADSYLSLDEARAFAEAFGWTLPVDDTEVEVALRNGASYVDMSEARFAGARLADDQGLAWPRVDSYKCLGVQQISIASDVVPYEIKKAQAAAAVEFGAGVDPSPVSDGKEVQEEKVGPITVKYFETGVLGGKLVITSAMDAMSSLLCVSTGNVYTLRTRRV